MANDKKQEQQNQERWLWENRLTTGPVRGVARPPEVFREKTKKINKALAHDDVLPLNLNDSAREELRSLLDDYLFFEMAREDRVTVGQADALLEKFIKAGEKFLEAGEAIVPDVARLVIKHCDPNFNWEGTAEEYRDTKYSYIHFAIKAQIRAAEEARKELALVKGAGQHRDTLLDNLKIKLVGFYENSQGKPYENGACANAAKDEAEGEGLFFVKACLVSLGVPVYSDAALHADLKKVIKSIGHRSGG